MKNISILSFIWFLIQVGSKMAFGRNLAFLALLALFGMVNAGGMGGNEAMRIERTWLQHIQHNMWIDQ